MDLREIDREIAEKIFRLEGVRYQEQGFHRDLVYGENGMAGVASLVPFYSSDIADAWKIFDKQYPMQIEVSVSIDGKRKWTVLYVDESQGRIVNYNAKAEAETAPLALCFAALGRSVGLE